MTESALKSPKKLIACCDGTWMNSDNGYVKGGLFSGPGHLQTPSNVTRIGRAILPEDQNHHPQIIYYQSGIGSGHSTTDRVIGGGTGQGIGENIREAYSFLANNYAHGDSIFLIGFSRGAFTARSIGGLIGGIGLLEKAGLPFFYLIFKDWENAGTDHTPNILDAIPDFKITSPPTDIAGYLTSYRKELCRRGLTRQVEIEAIGVWDTVGALGIPTPVWLQKIGLPDFLHEYKFFDTSLDNHVKHAFHAMALDEKRSSFGPTIWERLPGCNTVLKQVWFPGVHSNVGGSYDDTGIADITLAWMMDNLSRWIAFRPGYLQEQHLLNQKQNQAQGITRGWGLGKLYQSSKFPTNVTGDETRNPHLYKRMDYRLGKETNDMLLNTNETVHASVRARICMGGLGYEDKGSYAPKALKDWDLDNGPKSSNSAPIHPNGKQRRWIYNGSDPKGEGKVMLEDPLGPYELELLNLDPVAASEILQS